MFRVPRIKFSGKDWMEKVTLSLFTLQLLNGLPAKGIFQGFKDELRTGNILMPGCQVNTLDKILVNCDLNSLHKLPI